MGRWEGRKKKGRGEDKERKKGGGEDKERKKERVGEESRERERENGGGGCGVWELLFPPAGFEKKIKSHFFTFAG